MANHFIGQFLWKNIFMNYFVANIILAKLIVSINMRVLFLLILLTSYF